MCSTRLTNRVPVLDPSLLFTLANWRVLMIFSNKVRSLCKHFQLPFSVLCASLTSNRDEWFCVIKLLSFPSGLCSYRCMLTVLLIFRVPNCNRLLPESLSLCPLSSNIVSSPALPEQCNFQTGWRMSPSHPPSVPTVSKL